MTQGLPELFVERLKRIVPEELFENVLASFSAARPLAFRIQKPGIRPEEIFAETAASGIKAQPVPWYSGAFTISRADLRTLQETRLYKEGAIYVQGLSSMLVPMILDALPGERVLDLAAAPGSKASQLALEMRGDGELVANEKSKGRFFKLKAIMDAQGMPNVRLSMAPGEIWGRKEPESFDKVLLDAPCSSESKFSAADPKSLGYWKPWKIREMAGVQKKLLLSAFSALKPGGRLVYSTCTFAPEENEAVVDWALKKFGESAVIETISKPAAPAFEMPGMNSWEKETFDPALQRAWRILPGGGMDGFFICSIMKRESWVLERKQEKWKKRRS